MDAILILALSSVFLGTMILAVPKLLRFAVGGMFLIAGLTILLPQVL